MQIEFIAVQWRHHFEEEPIRIVSELDEQRMEARKLEFYKNGRVGYADRTRTANGTTLGSEPVPALSEINADPQFLATLIPASEFEMLWSRSVS